MNINAAIKTARTVITANSPVLLVGTAIAGVVTTGVLAARAGYKARGITIAAEVERGRPLELKEQAQLTWLCYASPAVAGASAIAATLGVHTIHTKRHAALAGLYAVTTSKLDDYQEKAEELLGSKKTQQLNDAIAQKRIDADGRPSTEAVVTEGGTELMYDDWSGRYFYGSVPAIQVVVAEINTQLARDGDATLNEYYNKVGLSNIPMGETFGWSGPDDLEPRFGSVVSPDGRPAVSVWFQREPKNQLGRV